MTTQILEFRYTNRGPLPWAIVRTNVIRLRRDKDGKLTYSRHYVCEDGTFDEEGISHTFDGEPTAGQVARQIHWGCCGWSARDRQIWQLQDKIVAFLDSES